MSTESHAESLVTGGRARPRLGDLALRGLAGAAVVLVLLLIALLVWEVAKGARLSFSTFGLGFITSTDWNVVTGQFGALYLIAGTLVTSLFGLAIAVPT